MMASYPFLLKGLDDKRANEENTDDEVDSEKLSEVSTETDETEISEVDSNDSSETNNDPEPETITEIETDQNN